MDRRRPGRPPRSEHGTLVAIDPTTGTTLGWSDGVFAGDPEAVARAELLCDVEAPLPLALGGPIVVADRGDPLTVVAVLRAALGGRGLVSGNVPAARLADELALPDGAVA